LGIRLCRSSLPLAGLQLAARSPASLSAAQANSLCYLRAFARKATVRFQASAAASGR